MSQLDTATRLVLQADDLIARSARQMLDTEEKAQTWLRTVCGVPAVVEADDDAAEEHDAQEAEAEKEDAGEDKCAVCGGWADSEEGHKDGDDKPVCDECHHAECVADKADRDHDDRALGL